MRNAVTVALPLAALFALAACSGQQAEPVPENETLVEPLNDAATVEAIDQPEAPVAAELPPTNVAPTLPPPEVADEEQIREDAEATGMTARLPAETSENETQPVE